MQRINNFILEVASKDEPTVLLELFDSRSQKQLDIGSSVICLIHNDDLVGAARGQRDGRRKRLCLVTNGI